MSVIQTRLNKAFEAFWSSFNHHGKGPKHIAKVAYMEGAEDARARLTQAEGLLGDELRPYFDDRADADQPAGCDRAIPNEEMRLLTEIDTLLEGRGTPDRQERTDTELLKRAITTARPLQLGPMPRWGAVRDTFAVGSTVAKGLCRRFGIDPDETVYGG